MRHSSVLSSVAMQCTTPIVQTATSAMVHCVQLRRQLTDEMNLELEQRHQDLKSRSQQLEEQKRSVTLEFTSCWLCHAMLTTFVA